MQILNPSRSDLAKTLAEQGTESLDFVILALGRVQDHALHERLSDCARVLRDGGLLFIQGTPENLPECGVALDGMLTFKYWIAIEFEMRPVGRGLPSVHAAVLLFTKGNGRFNIKRTRSPHQYCAHCGKTLKDWGGKTHLMHPEGFTISDVWTHLPPADNNTGLSQDALHAVFRMFDFEKPVEEIHGLIAQGEGTASLIESHPPTIPAGNGNGHACELSAEMVNVIHQGDAVSVLREYPDNSIDLVFADPPYNLRKEYGTHDDGWEEKRYLDWCNDWLAEYARILKPTGSLYVLNLPRWTMYHAAFLNRHLYLQNWIVWNALPDPRGKLLPAHYGLLFYTKHPTDFTFNYSGHRHVENRRYCLRASCIRMRKLLGDDLKEPLTDIWSDVFRIRHKRDRDYHPCQLPDSLLERIVRLSTNEGDIVLDALCGAGTTPIVAARLGRRYVGIDIDEKYVNITREKLLNVDLFGYVVRQSTKKADRIFTKKELQLELRALSAELGRLPTPEDVERLSSYDPDAFLSIFPTWGKALKAAKIEVSEG